MNANSSQLVIVGMSGGVDSSVAALLLREQGYRVEGLFMWNWNEAGTACTASADFQDARRVCADLDIPLHRASFATEYRQRVFDHFLAEYAAGRTPNPDILCNREIKFDVFLRHARRLGADRVATGHYARIERRDGEIRLLRGCDPGKDQSYFLHAVPGDALRQVLFPLGELTKPEVRAMAREAGLAIHNKSDSTGICFIGERDFAGFLSRYLSAPPGDIVTPDGHVVGRHRGLIFYTLGQRRGLGIGGRCDVGALPWYVVDKDLANNRLVVAQGNRHPLLYHDRVRTGPLHWIGARPSGMRWRAQAQIRYRHRAASCTVEMRDDGGARVTFDEPQWAVTPGQSLVFYRDDHCLGGGVIASRERTETVAIGAGGAATV